MTKKKDALSTLIQHLTPSEKRYFKLYAKGNGQQPNNKYIKLFDAVNHPRGYNEAALQKKLGYTNNSNSLAVAKNYLFQLILRALRHYHSGNNVLAEVIELLQDTHSLYARRLFGAAQKQLEKARKLAAESWRHDLLIIIGKWERRMVEQEEVANNYLEYYEDIMAREKAAAQQLQIHTTLFTQYKKLFFHNLREGFQKRDEARNRFFSLLQHPLLEEQQQLDGPVARLYYLLCYYEYYHGIRDSAQSRILAERARAVFEEHPFLIEVHTESYLTVQVNYLYTQMDAGKLEALRPQIESLRNLAIPKDRHDLLRRRSIDYFHLMMHYYELSGRYVEAVETLAPEVKAFFEAYPHSSVDRDEFYLKLTAAWIYLVVGETEEARVWLSYLENEIDRHNFIEFFTVCRLLQMTVHYDLQNYPLVLSLALSTQRLLEGKNKLSEVDAFVFRFFRRAGQTEDQADKQRKLLEQLRRQLAKVLSYTEVSTPYRLDELILWIDSHLQKQSLLELLLAQRQQASESGEGSTPSHLIRYQAGFVLRRGN